eukprot:GHUV01006306.1.p1 GENE.GHUV01006306.1~~GHUV01006306.1.p1  ORF type:complete len:259 (+),score=76.74 GHUV01006306.1:852-1628(+)
MLQPRWLIYCKTQCGAAVGVGLLCMSQRHCCFCLASLFRSRRGGRQLQACSFVACMPRSPVQKYSDPAAVDLRCRLCCGRYGDENVGFMSHMLGGAATDRLIGSGVRMDPTRVLHRAHMATAGSPATSGSSMQALYCVAAEEKWRSSLSDSTIVLTADSSSTEASSAIADRRGDSRSASRRSSDSVNSGGGSRRSSKSSLGCRHHSYPLTAVASYQDRYTAAAAGAAMAAAGVSGPQLSPLGGQPSWVDKEAALMMAG